MTYKEVLENAKEAIGPNCKVCPVCNGIACGNIVPGPGSKAPGLGANDNFNAWKKYRLEMDTFLPAGPVDLSMELFGRRFDAPLLSAPVGALNMQYHPERKGEVDAIYDYNADVITACAEENVIATYADGYQARNFISAAEAQKNTGAAAIPILTPYSNEEIFETAAKLDPSTVFAFGFVADSAGLPHLIHTNAGAKSVDDLKAIHACMPDKPFVVKGVLNAKAAEKVAEAGADAIIVSNHGGRVLPYAPATADVLPEIVSAVGKDVKIIVDGGLRSGADVLKALALGADAVMICRPIIISWYGGKAEGVKLYIEKIKQELYEAMYMVGARKLSDLTPEVLRVIK